MAHRRTIHSLIRRGAAASIFSPISASLQSLKPQYLQAQSLFTLHTPPDLTTPPNHCNPHQDVSFRSLNSILYTLNSKDRCFSSKGGGVSEDESDEEDEDESDGESVDGEDDVDNVTFRGQGKVYTPEEKVELAAEIGYEVVGPLAKTDRVFTPYEPVFAVVQVGSHQFKVSNRDCIFVERLKFCEVNDKIILNKVMLLGSSAQTIVGRPIVPEAAVHAVVEEHALDAKVIIFKKKRRKNYRRCKGHRQELTKLRITNIEGIEKPEYVQPVELTTPPKPKGNKGGPLKTRLIAKQPEKVPVSA